MDSTNIALASEYLPAVSADSAGIGEVTGSANVPTFLGVGGQTSQANLSSNGTTFSTITDATGNYDLFVPLNVSPFSYAHGRGENTRTTSSPEFCR